MTRRLSLCVLSAFESLHQLRRRLFLHQARLLALQRVLKEQPDSEVEVGYHTCRAHISFPCSFLPFLDKTGVYVAETEGSTILLSGLKGPLLAEPG